MKNTGDRHQQVFGKVFPQHEHKFFNVADASAGAIAPSPTEPATLTKTEPIKTDSSQSSTQTQTSSTMGHHGHHGGGGGFGWGGFYPPYYPYYPAETIVLDTPTAKPAEPKKPEAIPPVVAKAGMVGISTNALIGGAVGGTLGYLLAKQMGWSGLVGGAIGAVALGWGVSKMGK